MRLAEVVATSGAVAAASGRLEKVEHLGGLLKRLAPDEIEPAVAFLSGGPRQGRIGLGGRTLMDAAHVPPAAEASLDIAMRRFGRKLDVQRLRRDLPISPFFFDVLQIDGRPLVDDPQHERFAALSDLAPASLVVPHIETADPAAADAFFERALAAGHEGVMAKSPGAAYAAGRRGQAWLKVKRARTLDLVVLAAEWGHGRRRGTLSNLHLGARDPDHGAFVMLGKTFKGLTDEMLAWQTARLLELEIGRDAYTVYVRPQLVAEVAFNEIQISPQYPGGLALRFARVKRYRPDKTAAEADTIDAVRALAFP
jgi:DNA ligase-1